MKKIFNTILIASAAMFLLTACHDDLDIVYDNALSASNMWKDPSDLEQSVPGIYKRMRSFFGDSERNVFYLGEIRCGDTYWGPSLESKVQDNFKIACRHNTMTGSNTVNWSTLYSTIDQANAVLKHSGTCGASEDRVNWANAQAYFARAFCYFYGARIWGDIPLNLLPVESTSQEECYPEQATAAQVYAQVKADIEACEALGDVLGSEKYFGTKDALNMLKAEYGLWMGRTQDTANAATYFAMTAEALSAIGISDSRLLADYAKVFDRTNKKNAEIVFALNNTTSETGGYQTYFCQPSNLIASSARCNNGGPVPIIATQWWSYPQSMVDAFKAQEALGDTRVATNLGYGPYAASDGHEITWCNKLLGDMSSAPVVLDNDLLYYRYALAVMMDAELKYYQKDYSGALKSLNIIAKRAYGKDNYYTDTSDAAVLKALMDEYWYEFAAEGVIWWASIRTGKVWDLVPNNEIPGTTFKDLKAKNPNILLWPIANGSITKNPKIHQVKGWS